MVTRGELGFLMAQSSFKAGISETFDHRLLATSMGLPHAFDSRLPLICGNHRVFLAALSQLGLEFHSRVHPPHLRLHYCSPI